MPLKIRHFISLLGRNATIIFAWLLAFVLLPLGFVVSVSFGQPTLDRLWRLQQHLTANPNIPYADLDNSVINEVRSVLTAELPKEAVDRLWFHQIADWAPIPLDDAKARVKMLQEVADIVPTTSSHWADSGFRVRDQYQLFLMYLANYQIQHSTQTTELRLQLDSLLGKRSYKTPAQLGPTTRRATKGVANNEEHDSSIGRMVKYTLESILSYFIASPIPPSLPRDLEALNDSLLPNPEADFSNVPPIEIVGGENLESWLESGSNPRQRKLISTGQLQTIVSSEFKPVDTSNSPVVNRNSFAVSVYASDWRVFAIKRQWMNLSLLEKLRNNSSPRLQTRWMFEANGPLAAIPSAYVVAKDILFDLEINNDDDFRSVASLVNQGRDLIITLGAKTISIPSAAVKLYPEERRIAIAPSGINARVVAVISVIY